MPELLDGTPFTLHCLGGGDVPVDVLRDIRLLAGFSREARELLWRVLGPCLRGDPEDVGGASAIESRLDAFCREFDVRKSDLSRVIRSARFLFREAARVAIDRPLFERDLEAIFGGDGEAETRARAVLLAGYENAMEEIRAEIIEGTLVDHGKLLVDVDWRIDTLSTSNRGRKLQTPVVVLTLRYQEGERHERITLQALPGVLEKLRLMCETILE